MIKDSDESDSDVSDVDEFASRAAVDRMLEERDNKRKMEEQKHREAKGGVYLRSWKPRAAVRGERRRGGRGGGNVIHIYFFLIKIDKIHK